ncbi:MAG: cytidine/deoxycytidylate deaminase family protein [Desulfovibrio sp.]|nr:cytidine/deoxycytidylate deaminase family protein [Desulfovibrio sp.]
MSRLPWPDYFMNIARLVSERSTCLRRKVGAVAVKEKHILATGYNGAPRNMADCLELGCKREMQGVLSGQRHELCRGLHAEQNVIIQAAVHGVQLEHSVIYCTHQPCVICAKMLINCGVSAVYFAQAYPDPLSENFFAEAGIPLTKLEPTPEPPCRMPITPTAR